MFTEAEVRASLVFHLSNLVTLLLAAARQAAQGSAWDPMVAGQPPLQAAPGTQSYLAAALHAAASVMQPCICLFKLIGGSGLHSCNMTIGFGWSSSCSLIAST